MPLYDYKCANGHKEEDVREQHTAPTVHPCPICGADSERQMSFPSRIVFVQCINRIPI